MRKLLTMLAVGLLSVGIVTAQSRLITGKVTDSKGAPVPGATIKLKTGTAVAADESGNFKINASAGDVLTITSVNFGTEKITVNGSKSTYAVSLSDRVNMMDEFVVTAGGFKSKRKEIGTATTVISASSLTAGKATNI